MKKFSKLIPLLILALLVLSLSGCGGSSSSGSGTNSNSNSGSGNNDSGNGDNSGNDTGTNTEFVDTTNANVSISKGTDGVYKIVLSNGVTSSALADTASETLKAQEYVWHVSPDYAGEYWTNSSGTVMTEKDVLKDVTSQDGIFVARDIRYVPSYLEFSSTTVKKEQSGEDKCYVSYYSTKADGVDTANKYILAALPADNNNLETVKSSMTHSVSDAYHNPVLHITKPGSYDLSGTWQGQIWVDVPDSKKDPNAQVILILDGLNVNCTVAPAIVFKKVYECGSGDIASESTLPDIIKGDSFAVADKLANDKYLYAGAVVALSAGKTNTVTGTNLARLNNVEINEDYEKVTNSADLIGTFVKAQDKMYKLDGALHSRMSMVITNETTGSDGTLNVTSSNYEGLDSELHMLIDSGKVNVTAADDGINVNEDNISVFTQTGGTLTITSTKGDGIDSNGYAVFGKDKTTVLNITAGNSSSNANGEAGVDSELGTYGLDDITYTYTQASGNDNGGGTPPDFQGGFNAGGTPPTRPNR